MPLYNEEIYFIARSDAPLNFVHEIKDAKINVGPLRSGTAMSATTIYRQLFGAALPDANASFLSNEEALVKLVSDKSLDVVVVVAGQPLKLLVDMKPEARQLIKLLKFDPGQPGQRGGAEDLLPGHDQRRELPEPADRQTSPAPRSRRSSSPTTTRWAARSSRLRGFARSLCQNFPKLQAEGHPKWKEVQLATARAAARLALLPADGARAEELHRRCTGRRRREGIGPGGASAPALACTQQAKVLGLCK